MNLSMKKIFGIALLALALGFGFTSCSDDDEPTAPSTAACEASAGVYSGTWTRIQGTDTIAESGTLTFAATESANVTNVTATCAAIDVDYTSAANITYAIGDTGTGYIFTNGVSDNGFGTTFSGRITPEGKATIAYSKTVKVGRKSYTYNYTFEGTK
jgi:hypothetical protein